MRNIVVCRGRLPAAIVALCGVTLGNAPAQAGGQTGGQPGGRAGLWPGAPVVQAATISPRQLAQDVVANEIKLVHYDSTYLRYRTHIKDAKGDQVRDVIESKDGTVARVIQKGDRPLTAEEDADEHQRLQTLLDSPSAFRKHIEKDETGKKMAVDMIALLPDAMLFSFAPGQPQRAGKAADTPPELVLDFKPNPQWNPPNMMSQALVGLQGRCWIDARTHHLVRMQAQLFQGVNFGFGMLAHIFPGGEFLLEQEPVGEQRWIVDHFIEHVTVRAMMVKTLKENTDLVAFEFAPVPPMGYRDAIHMLLSTPLPK